MRQIMLVLMLTVMWSKLTITQTNNDIFTQTIQQLQNAGNLAAHDASLAIDATNIGNSQIIFNQTEAGQIFQQTFDENAGFDPSTNQATTDSRFTGNVTILTSAYIDDSNATFPYQYSNATYGINAILTSPAVIYVVQVQPRSYAPWAQSDPLTYPVIYQYQGT